MVAGFKYLLFLNHFLNIKSSFTVGLFFLRSYHWSVSYIDDDERKEFRSVSGCLQGLSGQSRPDLCATVSLSHRGEASTVADLKILHEGLNYAKQTEDQGICFPPVPLNRASIITYSDSSWANAKLFKSQYGVVVMICPAQVTEQTCYGYVVDWKSVSQLFGFLAGYYS